MKDPNMMRKPVLILGAALLAAALGVGALYARDAAAPAKVNEQHLLTSPLAGEPGKEVAIAIYTFPPGSSVPWHIHPDAQEFDYQIEGTLTLEVEGKPSRELKAGEAFYLEPNKSTSEPAKVYVVRTKPAGKPATELVEGPNDQ